MNHKSLVLVLNVLRYADDKIIAECLSEEEGSVTFVVRISHARRAVVRHTLFRPLAVLEVEWVSSPRGGMARPRAARTALPLVSLHAEPVKQALTLFLAEMLLHITRAEVGDARLFPFVVRSLEWLDAAPQRYANFHIVFLFRLAQFLGIPPNLDDRGLPFFDLLAGEFTALPPQHPHFVQGMECRAFAQLMRMNFGTMHLFALNRQERSRILRLVIDYYRLHLPTLPEPKSLDVLNEVFS